MKMSSSPQYNAKYTYMVIMYNAKYTYMVCG